MNTVSTFNNLITILSFLANIMFIIPFIVKVYQYFTNKKYIRKVLGYNAEPVEISYCRYQINTNIHVCNEFVNYSSVIATNNIIKVLNSVNQKYTLVQSNQDVRNELNLGGFIANKKVNVYFTKYFPKFKYMVDINKKDIYQQYPVDKRVYEFSTDGRNGFQIGENEFLDTTDEISDYAFLIKLTKDDFKDGNEKVVHILFGGCDIGTIMATEFLQKHSKEIYKNYGKGHYFFALEINRVDNSINYSKGIIDLTAKMFK